MHTIKVRGVIKREKSIFLMRDTKKHFYYLPWGTLEDGETFKQCLQREIVEETGIIPILWELVCIREFATEYGFYLDVWFQILNAADFQKIQKNNTTHGFEYYDEWFYSWSELHWKDVRPKKLQEILETSPYIDILTDTKY